MLNVIDRWCTGNGLSANPLKTNIILFTRKRNLPVFTLAVLKNVIIQFSDEVKYLGVILDKKLLWT